MIRRTHEDVNRVRKVHKVMSYLQGTMAVHMTADELREATDDWWAIVADMAGVNELSEESLRLLAAMWEVVQDGA